MTAAAAAILVLFDSAVFSPNVLAFALEIALMTAGAEGRVLGGGIDKRSVHAGAVAAAAAWVVPVVARIVPLGVMAEAGRRPARGDMTRVALDGGG